MMEPWPVVMILQGLTARGMSRRDKTGALWQGVRQKAASRSTVRLWWITARG